MLPAPPLLGGCEGPHSLLQVSVSVKPGTVVAKELFALFEGYLALLDAFGNPYFELPYEFLRVVLYVVENLGHGLAVYNLVYVIVSVLYADMNGGGVAEQIVHVAENFLICTDEEYA